MLRFAIGIDSRISFAADLERALSTYYYISEFDLIEYSCRLPCNNPRNIAEQVDCILQAIIDCPAQYYAAISSGRIEEYTKAGPVPYPVTVMTVIDTDGIIHSDRIARVGHYIPWTPRKKNSPPGPPDLIDIICSDLVAVAGTRPQPIVPIGA